MPAVVTSTLTPLTTSMAGTDPANLLDRLAEQIARNREVLGVHYRSDSLAGKNLAAATLDVLMACPLVTTAIAHATLEWP